MKHSSYFAVVIKCAVSAIWMLDSFSFRACLRGLLIGQVDWVLKCLSTLHTWNVFNIAFLVTHMGILVLPCF